jgi:hypothetical protein
MNAMTPQQVAEAARDAMWKDDRASQALGMTIAAVGPGSATVTMTVRPDMLNGFDICHGGLITTLADSRVRVRLQRLQRADRGLGLRRQHRGRGSPGRRADRHGPPSVAQPAAPASTTSTSPTSAATRWRCFAAALHDDAASRCSRACQVGNPSG